MLPFCLQHEIQSSMRRVGMSVVRFDFSWGDIDYHQETLENLKMAIKSTKKLSAVMLDTVGPELQVVNKSEHAISLEADAFVVLTPDEASSKLLPIYVSGLSKATKPGDTIFIGQYLFTGSETTSVWLEIEFFLPGMLCTFLKVDGRKLFHGSEEENQLHSFQSKVFRTDFRVY